MTIREMATNRLPTFGALRGQSAEFQMPSSVRESFERLIRISGQPQIQYGSEHGFAAHEAIADHQRKIRDQQFIDATRRMLEEQIRKKHKSNSR